MSFPPCLTAKQRAVLHELAEQNNLGHVSRGEGEQRCIVLGKLQDAAEQVLMLLPLAIIVRGQMNGLPLQQTHQ